MPRFAAVTVRDAPPSVALDAGNELVVDADPGYEPNPGHSGTGEIIALDTC